MSCRLPPRTVHTNNIPHNNAATNKAERPHQIELIAKLESYDCLQHLDAIINAADGIMVARGDLGAQVRLFVCGKRHTKAHKDTQSTQSAPAHRRGLVTAC